ncbi:MAG: UDP-N-acetylglucosamine 2-epimerase (hydrolyzing) [Elusimicrobia bacterium]|nr:UDP-N-acetylglucosamine 2-epimerase (hydrolyzing) [Elusimicrobiota bacterium]
MKQRKLCVVTGSRAEYGLLRRLMAGIRADPSLRLQVVVTGSHLEPAFGSTYREVLADGFRIDAKVPLALRDDSPLGVCRSLGRAVSGLAAAYARLEPDVVVLLGDRYEILAAAEAALIFGIPVAHISGGEVTEGSVDDSIRHAVTKLSHLHFPATRDYARRLAQLGEDPRRIFLVGDPGVENAVRAALLDREAWSRATGFRLRERNAAVAFHPATAEGESPERQFAEVLKALDLLPADFSVVFTRSNADVGGRRIGAMIDAFAARAPERRAVFASLGSLRWLSLLKNSKVLVGNSSSGIVEAPSLGVPSVDVGDRQKGRLRAASVVHCRPRAGSVSSAIRRALSLDCRRVRNPYGGGDVSARILRALKTADLAPLRVKRFYDLPRGNGKA